MAITPDNATLVLAESYGKRLTAFDIESSGSLSHRRAWANLGDGVPDGICLEAEGAVWYADAHEMKNELSFKGARSYLKLPLSAVICL